MFIHIIMYGACNTPQHTYIHTHTHTSTMPFDSILIYNAVTFSFLQIDVNSQFGSSTLVPYTIIPINTTGCGPGAGLCNTLRATELTYIVFVQQLSVSVRALQHTILCTCIQCTPKVFQAACKISAHSMMLCSLAIMC